MLQEEQPLALAPVIPNWVARAATFMLFPLFFASGMAGLIYEIVWTRMLLYVFGSSLYAVTAVLTAFMAGLALGSALIGRRSDRLRYPLRFYAIIELAIGSAGFLLPAMIESVDGVDAWAYARLGENFAALTGLRFVVSFLLLLVPTTLMGATLPVMSKALARREESLGVKIGLLYAINTAGAVAGAALAAFYLIGQWGVERAEYTAAVLNFIASAGAFVISTLIETKPAGAESEGATPAQADAAPGPDEEARAEAHAEALGRARRTVMIAAFGSGLVAMGAQVVWSRALVFSFEFLKNTTYAFSAMLAVFLTGLALGGAACGAIIDRQRNPLRLYGIILGLAGVAIIYSMRVIFWGAGASFLPSPLMEDHNALNWPRAVMNILTQSALAIGVPTFLMGMTFPASVRSMVTMRGLGAQVGRLYAINTLGAVIGPILTCFILIPVMGLTWSIVALGSTEVLLGVYAISRSGSPRATTLILALVLGGAALGLSATLPAHGALQWLDPGHKLIHYDEAPMATVAVVENSFGYRTINIDGVGVAGTDPMLQTDQKSLAHVGTLLADDPKAALTVGFGSGGASYSFLRHDSLERVDCVEILPDMPEAAPHLTDANHGFLENPDPRYRIIFEDARAYLQHTKQTYDVIATDCTDLRYKSNANLYDVEYFRFCRERLRPGGLVVVWMPLAGLSDEMFRIALRTFHHVFPAMSVLYMNNEPTHYILLLGWRDEMKIDYGRLARRLQEPDVKADLAELHLDDPVKIISCWVTGGEPLSKWLAGDKYNTEAFPILEFESPKFGYGDRPIIDNLDALVKIRNSPREFMVAGSLPEADAARLAAYEEAMPAIVAGHAHYRLLELDLAAREYARARALAPNDKSVRALLDFRELRQTAMAGAGNPQAWLALARVYREQDRADEAVDAFRETIAMVARNPAPNPRAVDCATRAQNEMADLIEKTRAKRAE